MGALIFVAIALGLIVSAQKKKGLAALVDQDEQAKAIFNVIGGRLVYKPTMRKLIVDSLFSRVVQLTNEPSLLMLVPGPGEPMPAQAFGAWFMLKSLHSEGFNIWVPTNTHIPVAIPLPVLFLPPTEQGPAEGFARLIASTEPWPAPPPSLAAFAAEFDVPQA